MGEKLSEGEVVEQGCFFDACMVQKMQHQAAGLRPGFSDLHFTGSSC